MDMGRRTNFPGPGEESLGPVIAALREANKAPSWNERVRLHNIASPGIGDLIETRHPRRDSAIGGIREISIAAIRASLKDQD